MVETIIFGVICATGLIILHNRQYAAQTSALMVLNSGKRFNDFFNHLLARIAVEKMYPPKAYQIRVNFNKKNKITFVVE